RIIARLQTSADSRDRASAAGREVVAQCRQSDVETLEWVLSEIDAVLASPEPDIALLRTPRGEGESARRSDAQREDRWEDLIFGPIAEAYNEAHAAHPSDRSDDNASM